MSAAALISLRDIRKSYGREGDPDSPATQVLRGISLDIHAGEFVAIVGACIVAKVPIVAVASIAPTAAILNGVPNTPQ